MRICRLGRELAGGWRADVLHDRSAGAFAGPDVCFIFAPDGYDEPDILRSRKPQPASQVLTADNPVT
jgi:hypothetical protein